MARAQRDNPDLLIWPGREVITYFGHMIVLGETPSGIEYRVGYEGIGLDEIQRSAAADGALVSRGTTQCCSRQMSSEPRAGAAHSLSP